MDGTHPQHGLDLIGFRIISFAPTRIGQKVLTQRDLIAWGKSERVRFGDMAASGNGSADLPYWGFEKNKNVAVIPARVTVSDAHHGGEVLEVPTRRRNTKWCEQQMLGEVPPGPWSIVNAKRQRKRFGMDVPERENLGAGRSRSTSVIKKKTKGVSHLWMKHTAHAYQNLI